MVIHYTFEYEGILWTSCPSSMLDWETAAMSSTSATAVLSLSIRNGIRRPTSRWLSAENYGYGFTVETHLHADFVSGSRELIAEGAELLAPGGSDLAFDHRRLEDGEEIDLGGMTLRAIATPGHTPEHLAYLLLDDASPLALFSGGTLIAGGVARTDLLLPDLTEPLARAAYRSIRDRLLVLPDDLAVYPTHGAGSFCSTASTGERTTTIREGAALEPAPERRHRGRLRGDPARRVWDLPALFWAAAGPQSRRTGGLRRKPAGPPSTLTG